jgi:hypothetical protein
MINMKDQPSLLEMPVYGQVSKAEQVKNPGFTLVG